MFNIPNVLSILRIFLIPFFCKIFIQGEQTGDYVTAAAILAVSGLTDVMDGYIARKYHMITRWGKILDPIADKLTLLAVCICLWIKLPKLGLIFLFFMGKEIIIMLGSAFLMKKSVVLEGAKWFGKLYTVIFYIVMVLIVLFDKMPDNIRFGLLCFMGCFTILSLCLYVPIFLKLNNTNRCSKT